MSDYSHLSDIVLVIWLVVWMRGHQPPRGRRPSSSSAASTSSKQQPPRAQEFLSQPARLYSESFDQFKSRLGFCPRVITMPNHCEQEVPGIDVAVAESPPSLTNHFPMRASRRGFLATSAPGRSTGEPRPPRAIDSQCVHASPDVTLGRRMPLRLVLAVPDKGEHEMLDTDGVALQPHGVPLGNSQHTTRIICVLADAGGVVRIATWNCRSALDHKLEVVDAINADVLTIQECSAATA